MRGEREPLAPLGPGKLLALFGVPTLLNAIACRIGIPWMDARGWMPIEATYFLCVGLLVLVPMFVGAVLMSGEEIGSFRLAKLFGRMRVKGIHGLDWLWTVATFLLLAALSYLIAGILMPRLGLDATPFFFRDMPLGAEDRWILAVWPLFFFFNIFGEEFLWRGYIQPRQELLTGRWTWLVHGLLWAIWHIPMGMDIIVAALPIFFILPAVVQLRRNTSIAIVVHTAFGAFGFLSLALGVVHG